MNSQVRSWSNRDLLDHVVGIGSRAAGAVATQRAVNVSGEMIREIRDLKAALQARLPAHNTPVKKQGQFLLSPQESSNCGGFRQLILLKGY